MSEIKKVFSKDEKKEILKNIEAQIEAGQSIDKAIAAHKIHKSTYYGWKNGRASKNSRANLVTMPIPAISDHERHELQEIIQILFDALSRANQLLKKMS